MLDEYAASATRNSGLVCTRLAYALATVAMMTTGAFAAAPTDTDNLALSEITVTAQRRAEPLDTVPISVTAMSQTTLDDFHIQNISDLASIVPGLVLRTSGAGQVEQSDIAIRGIVNNSSAPTTGVYIDETPITLRALADAPTGTPQPELFDLERVEVLRGPQGTLFGSGAEGGAIRFITPQPSLDTYSGYTKAEFSFTDGGDPNYQVGVAYGGPIIDGKAGFRVSGWFQNLGGYIDKEDPISGSIVAHNANYGSSYVLRPALKLAPSEQLTITVATFLQHDDQHEPAAYWLNGLPNSDQGHLVSGYAARPNVNDLVVPNLNIQYDFNNFTLQSDTSYLHSTNSHTDDYTYYIESALSGGNAFIPGAQAFAARVPTLASNNAWQQEIRISSKDADSRFHWVLGLFYRTSTQSGKQFLEGDLSPITQALFGKSSLAFFGIPDVSSGFGPLSGYAESDEKDEQKAIFGEVNYEIVKGLRVIAGVRIERTTVNDTEIDSGPLLGLENSTTALPQQSETPITPRFGVNYQFNDHNMIYATAAKGYREGGANSPLASNPTCGTDLAKLGLTAAPASFSSDSVWSYELGTKNTLLDRRLQLQASAYYISWTKIQQNVGLPDCGEAFIDNLGAAVSKGFDLQVAAQVTDNLKLGGFAGYTDAYYPNTVFGAAAPLENAGDHLAGVLPWTYAVNAEYRGKIINIWSGSEDYLRADFRWLGRPPAGDPTLPNYIAFLDLHRDPAYSLLNLRAGITKDRWDISLFINNATNSNPLISIDNSANGNLYSALRIQPRTVGITAYYRF